MNSNIIKHWHKGKLRLSMLLLCGLLFAIFSVVMLTRGISEVFSSSEVPRIDYLQNGGKRFVLESLRNTVLFPIVLVLLVVFAALASYFSKSNETENAPKAKQRMGLYQLLARIGRSFDTKLTRYCFLGIAIWLFLHLAYRPLFTIHIIEVHRDNVHFHSLFQTWSYARSDVQFSYFKRQNCTKRRDHKTALRLIVHVTQSRGGKHFQSDEFAYYNGDPRIGRHALFFQWIQKSLLKE